MTYITQITTTQHTQQQSHKDISISILHKSIQITTTHNIDNNNLTNIYQYKFSQFCIKSHTHSTHQPHITYTATVSQIYANVSFINFANRITLINPTNI